MLSEKDLATALHRNFCIPKNVRCRWYYETECKGDTWRQPIHKGWLEKAQNVIKGSNNNIEQILNALGVVSEVKRLLKK